MNKFIALLSLLFLFPSCFPEDIEPEPDFGTNDLYSGLVIVGNFMYNVNLQKLVTFDVTDPEDVIETNRQDVGFMIESIFHLEGNLFIGSDRALHIFEIDANGIPNPKSQTQYFNFSSDQTQCDPVISDTSHVFVTLSDAQSTNTLCQRIDVINELRIYDIANLSNPVEVNRIDMIDPKGMAFDDDILFVCENEGGLKVFDKSDVLDLQLIHHFEGINTYDVVAKEGLLIAIGHRGIYQFDYTSIADMELISTIDL